MLRIILPPIIYTAIMVNAHRLQISPYLVMAVTHRESTFAWDARGDWGTDRADRYPGDWLWQPNAEGLYPHSFGLMQLSVNGAGAYHTPAELLDISNNVRWGCDYLKRCLGAFGGDWERAISAYNQGIQGVKDNGIEVNRPYINDVMALVWQYAGAGIHLGADRGGHWGVTFDEISP